MFPDHDAKILPSEPKKRRTNIIQNVKTKVFSAEDICGIIETCYKCRVSKLKLGQIELRFDILRASQARVSEDKGWLALQDGGQAPVGQRMPDFIPEPENPLPLEEGSPREGEFDGAIVNLSDEELSPDQRELFRDIYLAQLSVENPLGYESEVIDELLLDDRDIQEQAM